MGYFENKEVKKNKTNYHCPRLNDNKKLHIKFPSTPRSIKLEGLKTYKAQAKSYNGELCIKVCPRYPIPVSE